MNHIYRLVWCRSRRALVVASELASSRQGGSTGGGQSLDSRPRAPAKQLLLVAMLGAAGLMFTSGASAQSAGDAKLNDLQSLMAKYAPAPPASQTAMPATVLASNVSSAALSSTNAVAAGVVRRTNAVRPVITRLPSLAAAKPVVPVVAQTLSPIAAATTSIPVFAPNAVAAPSRIAADHTVVALAPPTQGNSQVSTAAAVDAADRRTALAAGAQVALQSSSIQVADAPVPPIGDSLVALPAIKPTVLPIAARLTTALTITPLNAASLPPVVIPPATVTATTPNAAVATTVAANTAAINTPVPNVMTPSVMAGNAAALPAVTPAVAVLTPAVASVPASPRAVAAITTPVATPAATVAADAVAEAAAGAIQPSVAATAEVADRRLTHATTAAVAATAKTTDLLATTDGTDAAVSGQSTATVIPSASPLSFAAVSSLAATTPSPLAAAASANASAAVTPQAVPVFPTPGAAPTGLIVGNGGVVGTTTQLLGPTSNSLFAGGNGYVTNGSLMVNNANFSQGYSVVSVLGVPLLTLNPVGTVLTSTTGAVVGGTGVNSHLTLLGGVTSDNYITGINNGGPDGLLGVALPTSAPAYAASCLNALAVRIACYGVNAAQDYQVLVGDGATANGSKEVVIGTNASHTLPAVSADVAFPGAGRNDATNPTGVPTADYEARLGHSVVVGDEASGTANAQTILGAEANASAANSVALGFQSAANRGGAVGYTAYGLTAPQTSVGEVSIGSPGAERQITNVAAGSAGTDAVNVLQLQGVVAAAAGDSVEYDDAGHTVVTLSSTPPSTDGGVTGGTTVTNLHQGALTPLSTDAVNGSQLFATNSTVNNIVNTTSKYFQANSTNTPSSAVGLDSLAAGPQSVSTGPASVAVGSGATSGSQNSVAIGTGANASFANSVALGNGSATVVGAQANYTALGLAAPQTSLGEVNVGTRQITGVSAGEAGTDAVNVAQLAGVSAVADNAVQYDTTVPADTRVTLAGPASIDGGVTGGTTVTNLHQGALTPLSTDAVNGSQLFATNSTINNVINTSSKYYQANSVGVGSVPLGIDSLAAGPTAVATGDGSIAEGSGATTLGLNSVALGTGASGVALNSVALGAGSLALRGPQLLYPAIGLTLPQNSAGSVSVGAVGAERQITNVAAGQIGTDAVNVAQLAGVSAVADNAVQYDTTVPADTRVTLAGPASADGGVTGGTTVTNVHQGALNATSTDAVNGSQLFATNNSISNIVNTTSKYYQANSTGIGSVALGTNSLAQGPTAVATGDGSIAEGSGATTLGVNSVALGTGASSVALNSVALGAGSLSLRGPQAGYAAIGLSPLQNSVGEVSVGAVGAERQITNVAAGSAGTDAVNVAQLAGVSALADNAVQYDTTVPADTRVTLAGPASTDGGVTGGTTVTNVHQGALNATSTDAVNGSQLFATNNSISNIVNTTSKYYQANSTGAGSIALGTDSLASGPQAVATGDSSIAEGNGATTLGANSVAIGTGASVTPLNSVALGAGSLSQRGALANYAAYGLTPLQNSVGEVSVGAAGADRQITNVAAGQAATDAVNVAQLQGVSASAANAVQYDNTVPAKASVTLGGTASTDGGVTGGTLITNLHRGAVTPLSTDAINGSQLYGWTEDTTNPYSNTSLYNDFTNTPANKYLSVSSVLPGATTLGVDSVALGPLATATADNALAVGTGANANMANSIALGAGSVTTVGARIGYIGYGLATPQTSSGELNVGNRQITGVAAASTPDGAVNLAQLQAVVGAVSGPTPASKLAVLYTPDAAGNPTNAVALTGDGTGAPVAITNVAAGAETPTSTAAVNGSQVWHWSQDTTNMYSNTSLYNDISALGTGNTSNKYVQVNSTLGGATASGTNSVAVGPAAVASGANSVALGNGAQAASVNSVALGSGSVATRDNTVSVGNVGTERQVTNVAAGTADTDAANVGQVNAGVQQAQNWATSYTDQKFGALSSEVQQIGNRANAGVAAAMAMAGLPQAYEPGKSMAAVAAGTFRSESSIAVGVSTISEGGRWVYKMTGSMDSRGDGGVSVGAGMQW